MFGDVDNSNGAGGSVVRDGVGSEGKPILESKSGQMISRGLLRTYQAGNLAEQLVLKKSVINRAHARLTGARNHAEKRKSRQTGHTAGS